MCPLEVIASRKPEIPKQGQRASWWVWATRDSFILGGEPQHRVLTGVLPRPDPQEAGTAP